MSMIDQIELFQGTSPNGQHWNQIDYIFGTQRWRSSKQSAKQDQELTLAQIMKSLLPNSDLNCVQYSSVFIPSGYHISDSLV